MQVAVCKKNLAIIRCVDSIVSLCVCIMYEGIFMIRVLFMHRGRSEPQIAFNASLPRDTLDWHDMTRHEC